MSPSPAFSPRVEVWGTSILGVLKAMVQAGLSEADLAKLMEAHQLPVPLPDGWYPQVNYLAVLEAVAQVKGQHWLRNPGRIVPLTSKFPPEIRTLERALRTLDVAYHMNHRGGPIGGYLFEPQGTHSGRMHCDTPYGCDFDLGILQGLGTRFHSESPVLITHLLDPGCRSSGGAKCVYQLDWSTLVH